MFFGSKMKTSGAEKAARRGDTARPASAHDIEPELFRRTPRKVRVRPFYRRTTYALAHVIVGASLFLYYLVSSVNEGRQPIPGVETENLRLTLYGLLVFSCIIVADCYYKIWGQFNWLSRGEPVAGTVIEGYETGRGSNGPTF